MASTRANRKKQTTLSFSPLPPTSLARASQSEAIQERAAAVTFVDASQPAKRRKTIHDYLPSPSSSDRVLRFGESQKRSSPSRTTRSFMTGQTKPEENNVETANNPTLSHLHSLGIFDDSESDVPSMFTTPTKRARGNKFKELPWQDVSSSDEIPVTPPSKRRASGSKKTPRAARTSKVVLDDDDDDDDDDLPPRPPRRVPRTPSKQHRRSTSEQDKADIDEDLDFLGEVNAATPRADRRVSEKKIGYQRALAALKKKRMQRHEQHSDQPNPHQEDDGDDGTSDANTDHETENESRLDNNDEDFIVDDEDDTLGEPVELPFQFSNLRSKRSSELFGYVVEWMVQKKINPAFAMDDDRYKISFNRLDDFVKGLGGSKYQSSAWTAAFTKALKSLPVLKSHELEICLSDRCEACNRSGHPATWEVSFQGKTYNEKSLEEDSTDDDGDSSTNSDRNSATDKTFQIGRFCFGNAEIAHTLAHWRFHLKEWVIEYLEDAGELSTEKIVQRDKWTTSKRQRDADRILESMENNGKIRALYADFKGQVTSAQYANDTSGFGLYSP